MAVLEANFFSSCLKRTVTMMVILPVDKFSSYDEGLGRVKPFKTLYLLHGLLGDHRDWLDNGAIRRLAEDHDLAVIMPAGENAFYVDSSGFGHDYGEFIGKELVQMSRRMFPLSHKREDTFIAGLSMGGYGAVRNGFKYFKTFSYIGAFSGALHFFETARESPFGASDSYIDRKKAGKSDLNPKVCLDKLLKSAKGDKSLYPHVYLSCGEEDDLMEANVIYRDYLKQKGIDVKWHSMPGGHEWDVWRAEIRNFIDFLPLGQAKAGIGSDNVK